MEKEITENIFIARQPIFDKKQNVWAYELLFRDSITNKLTSGRSDDEYTTLKVIANTILNFGVNSLTEGKKAFINFGYELIVNEIPYIFPKNILGVEILETIEPDKEVLNALKELKKNGYLLVLDDFIYLKKFLPILNLADIVKIETFSNVFEKTDLLKQKSKNKNIEFLAEKVETQEEYKKAKELGYSYFQGFFFCKPEIISVKDIPGNKLHYLHLLKELNRPNLKIKQIENIIKKEVSITYKLFKFINSANFGLKATVSSISHALNLLGDIEIKKWLSFLVLSSMGRDKPNELIKTTIIRARYAERITELIGEEKQSEKFFMLGMFSLIDTILSRPMEDILNDLPIDTEIKSALLGRSNIFRKVLDLVVNYERANWESFSKIAKDLNCKEQELAHIYIQSVEWARAIS